MIEHKYYVCKSSWWIYIEIVAEYVELNKCNDNFKAVRIGEGLWLKFADKPIIENELFCNDDLPYLMKGLEIVQNEIIKNSLYKDTLIIIHSLQFSPCDFQEEGVTAAIIEWASKAFDFSMPRIKVDFCKEKNRYIFDFG